MPLQEFSLSYLPSRIASSNIYPNQKLLTESEIAAVIEGYKDKPDGRYRKDIFNRIEMRKNYGIIKHKDKYFAVYKKTNSTTTHEIYDIVHIKVKIAQDLETGEWLRLKVYKNKAVAQNEFNYLITKDLAYCKFSRRARNGTMKHYVLTKIIPAVDLIEFVQKDKHIPVLRCLELAIDLLKKIKEIHDDGYLLCKMTHQNIICLTQNTVGICDYDSITKMDADGKARHPLTGTDIFLAPELLDECHFIELLRALRVSPLAKKDKLSAEELLIIVNSSEGLNGLRDERKVNLVKKFKLLSLAEIQRLMTIAFAKKPHGKYTYDKKTESYATGITLKVLFNLPVEVNYIDELTTDKYFKIGKEKIFGEHEQIIKWLDGMTAKNAEGRLTIEDALEGFEAYYQKLLSHTQIKIAVIDISDFDSCRYGQGKTLDGFWSETFKMLAQQMDEIQLVSRQVIYPDQIRIQQSLYRLGLICNQTLIVTPTVEALAQVPAYINDKSDDSLLRSYTYFDFSLYAKADNKFYVEHNVRVNGVSSVPNGHNHTNGIGGNVTTTAANGTSSREIMTPQKINELLLENGMNVIKMDIRKSLAIYSQQLSQCLTTLTVAQFKLLKSHLQNEVVKYESQSNAEAGNLSVVDYLIRLKSALTYLTNLESRKGLSYTIAHSTLDNLQRKEKLFATFSLSRLFMGSSIEKLQRQIKIPTSSTLKLSK